MFRIAICDDEEVICAQIENIILDYALTHKEKIDIQVFYSGEELCKFLEMGQGFDLLFLDIMMKMLNGIEVGRKIREEMDNQFLQIVYVTGNDNYFKEMFDVRPMHFIQKPIDEAEIIKDVRLALRLSDKLGGTFIYRKAHQTFRVPVKEIIYFESSNREVKMVTIEGTEIFYSTLDEVHKQLAKYHFMHIHKSYVVNYFLITKFRYDEVTMSNNEVLPISQARRKVIRELQLEYEKEGLI